MAGKQKKKNSFCRQLVFLSLRDCRTIQNISRNLQSCLFQSAPISGVQSLGCCIPVRELQEHPKWEKSSRNIMSQSLVSNQAVCMADWVAGCNYVYDNNRPIVSECSSSVLWLQGVPSSAVVFQLSETEIQTWWVITGLSGHPFIPLIHSGPAGSRGGGWENMHKNVQWHTSKQ